MTELIGFGAGDPGGPVVATLQGEEAIVVTQAVFTHTLDIGAAFPGRFVVVALSGYRGTTPYQTTITGVTFNGVAVSFIQNVQTYSTTGLAYAYVPSGTSLTVVVTYGTSSTASSLAHAYSLTNVTTGQVANASSGTSASISLANPEKGTALIAMTGDAGFVSMIPVTGDFTASSQLIGASSQHRSVAGHLSEASVATHTMTTNTQWYSGIVAAFR